MSTLQDRITEAFAYRRTLATNPADVTQADLAAACGVKPPSVNDWFSGKTGSLKAETALRAAAYLRVRPEWLASNSGPMTIERKEPEHLLLVAQSLSHSGHRMLPPLYSWEGMMGVDLPDEFRLVVEEASLPKLVPAGSTVLFNRLVKPRPGDGVLVEDGSGMRHFRRYRQGAFGQWEAYAMNDAYRDLDSKRDSLKVIAVYAGSEHSLADL